MNISDYIRSFIKFSLYHQEGNRFANYFNLINKYLLRWPITVGYSAELKCYSIEDAAKNRIYYSVPRRTERFKAGIETRLIFLKNEYMIDKCQLKDNDIIIDVGANIGEIPLYLNSKLKCRIIAIEPEEKEFNCLIQNTKETNTVAHQVALWSEKKAMTLYQKNDSNDSSLIEISDYKAKKEIFTETLNTVIENEKINSSEKIKLLKLEAEGAEPEILVGGDRYLEKIEYVSADIGPERGLKKETTLVALNDILLDAGFKLVDYYHKRGVVLYKNRFIL